MTRKIVTGKTGFDQSFPEKLSGARARIFGKQVRRKVCSLIAGFLLVSAPVFASELSAATHGQYSASFEKADISEFANTVSATLNKSIILDPAVRGSVTVRSYDKLTAEQYYQLFLNVLEVHGFAVIEQDNNVLKIVQDKNAKMSAIQVADSQHPGEGDEFVTWVLPVQNVPVRELSPLLRQLNDTAGNVVHYDPSNILLLTGRAANVKRLVEIVRRVDMVGNRNFSVIQLEYASASEMQRILTSLLQEKGGKGGASQVTVVADDRGNRLIVAGQARQLQKVNRIVYQLDAEQESSGNTRVFYLRYAKAADLKEVMEGVGQTVQAEKDNGKSTRRNDQKFSINVHEQTNALVVTAQPDMMKSLEGVIKQLDIRRAQVLVEAIIVEVTDGDGINLSFQLANANGSSLMQFNDGRTVPIGQIMAGLKDAEDTPGSTVIIDGNTTINPDQPGDYGKLYDALAGVSGAAFSITSGDWTALLQAVTTSSKSNVLATPSLMTLDNEEASFIVGDEVPVITGAASGSNNDNPFQTVDRKEVGVKMTVTPQINEGDSVKLAITQEVSGVNGTTSVDVTFSKREVKTSVLARSGDTIVIGGLLDEDVQESVSKVPLLGDIPFIGALFRSTSSEVKKRNLMVFLRPTIIRDDNILTSISGKKYSYMRARQLDRRDQGVELMPNARTPVLPEYPSNSDLMNRARQKLDEAEQKEAEQKEAEQKEAEQKEAEQEKNVKEDDSSSEESPVASNQSEKNDAESGDNS
ncbi:type II secretion system secretin GspD [Endozoicomonas numazuensis]|uniref:type II secretion system secretin GspD n=1 Tax=Endozoicomonas numazuensis TaxID=1137799 RepID=UPI00147043C9|nr:type II secretion system secretin GspD [Endozoicomonas numazuensis]